MPYLTSGWPGITPSQAEPALMYRAIEEERVDLISEYSKVQAGLDGSVQLCLSEPLGFNPTCAHAALLPGSVASNRNDLWIEKHLKLSL